MSKALYVIYIVLCSMISHAQLNEWSWINGDSCSTANCISQYSYGIQGTAASTNYPPPRYQCAYWTDKQGNFWIFGGSSIRNNGSYLVRNDLWRYNPYTNLWTWMKGDTIFSTGSYGTKGIPASANSPAPRGYGANCWVDSVGDLWLFGGSGSVNLNDLWRYNITTNQWTWISGENPNASITSINPSYGTLGIASSSNFPGIRYEIKSGWTIGAKLFMFGGQTAAINFRSDIWSYNVNNGLWTWEGGSDSLNPKGVKGTIGDFSTNYHPSGRMSYTKWRKDSLLYIFGGGQFDILVVANSSNDYWVFNIQNRKWAYLGGQSTNHNGVNPNTSCNNSNGWLPSSRWENQSIETTGCINAYWLYGGFIDSTTTLSTKILSDLWFYKLDSNKWLRVSGNDSVNLLATRGSKGSSSIAFRPPSLAGIAIFTDTLNRVYLFGGFKPPGFTFSNELWRYTPSESCLQYSLYQKLINKVEKTTICNNEQAVIVLNRKADSFKIVPNRSYSLSSDSLRLFFQPNLSTSYKVIAYKSFCKRNQDSVTFSLQLGDSSSSTVFDTTCKNVPRLFNELYRNSSGVYKDTLMNNLGCDSFIYYHLFVKDTSRKDSFLSICINQSFSFNGLQPKVTGVYKDTLINYLGCDSFLYLHLTVIDTSKRDSFLTICKNQHVQFNGNSFNSTGVYKDTLVNSSGCDSFIYLRLTVKDTSRKDSFLAICRNQSIIFNSWKINTEGIYKDTLTNYQGCDSFLYLNLTIRDTSYINLFDTTCINQPKLFNGNILKLSGLYRDTLVNAIGCDSFIYYHLFVLDTSKKDSFLTICKNESVTFNGSQINTTGVYKDTLTNTFGCDRFLYLHLTVNDSTKKDSFLTICKNQHVQFNGILINSTGIYKDTLINSVGCDSFLFLNLTVNDTSKKDSFLSICKNSPVVFNGVLINLAGTYKDTLANYQGCDSFIYLYLSNRDTSYINLFDTTCKNQPKLFDGNSLNLSGIYRDTLVNVFGCDSFIYYNLFVKDTNNRFLFDTVCHNDSFYFNNIYIYSSGLYLDTLLTKNGCDSFLYLSLHRKIYGLRTYDTASCFYFAFKGKVYHQNRIILDTIRDQRGCEIRYDSIYLRLYSHKVLEDTSIRNCRSLNYQGINYTRDSTFLVRTPMMVFPYCDSLIQRVNIKIHPLPTPTLRVVPDTIVKYGSEVELSARGGLQYKWNVSNERKDKITIPVKARTYVEVTVTDNKQCDSTVGVWLDVLPKLEIVEIFSPNGDGQNDFFVPRIQGNVAVHSWRVFNRWGQKIYESVAINPGWDGTYAGQEQPQGSYVYQIEYSIGGERKMKTGAITLIR